MNQEIERLIDMALADGTITDRERSIIRRKAESLGVDPDEAEMILDGKQALRSQPSASVEQRGSKQGEIKKCPACGAIAKAFTATCSDCGTEFRGIESTVSVKAFFEQLNKLEEQHTEEEETNPLKAIAKTYAKIFSPGGMFGDGKVGKLRRELIRNYPVPNTREDILEFLSLAVPRSKTKGNFITSTYSDGALEMKRHNLMAPIWRTKCEELIMKARFSMREDKQTIDQIEYYAQQIGLKM